MKHHQTELEETLFILPFILFFGVQMAQRDENEVASGKYVLKSRKSLLNVPALYGYNCNNLGVWCDALIQMAGQ
ncbi:hypothetical protein EGQ77_09100 [bacterium]|nr:hypothetical protein [bacterium]